MKIDTSKFILSFIVLLLLFSTFVAVKGGENTYLDSWIIEQDEIRRFEDEEIILDERLIIKGSLQIRNSDLFIKGSEGGEIIIEEGGILKIENSLVQPYYRRYHPTISLELEEGYNTLSFPFYREDYSTKEVLEPLDGHYESAWYYSQESGWLSFRPHREEHFNDLNKITTDIGVNVEITDELTFENSGFLPKSNEIELHEGYNLVSYPSSKQETVSSVFSNILDRIESIYTVKSGENVYLTLDDTMTPGRGYWIQVDRDCTWEFYNENGLTEEEALDFEMDNSISIDYKPGSLGHIKDSRLEYLGDSDEDPGLIIQSDSVSLEDSNLERNYIGVSIVEGTPSISGCSFENSAHSDISSFYSSFNAYNNKFSSSEGYAVKVTGGAPTISENYIIDNKGIYLENSKARVFSNEIHNTLENGILINQGDPRLEKNDLIENPTGIKTRDSNASILDNIFYNNQIGLDIDDGKPIIEKNLFNYHDHGILIQQGNAVIKNNEIRNIEGWGIDIRYSENITIIGNNIRSSTFGIQISGNDSTVIDNLITEGQNGVMIKRSNNFIFESNTINRNSNTGLTIEESEGAVIDNQINNNHVGVEIKSSISFLENTVSNNKLYGINVRRSSPYFHGNILSNNEENAFRFEGSDSTINRASILNSRYHIYLINTRLTVINSAFSDDMVYLDDSSELTVKNNFNASVDEGATLRDYSIYESLPPSADVTSFHGNDRVEVVVEDDSIYFKPEDYFSGTINMTFNVTIMGEWETEVPFVLDVNPVNNPPKLFNKSVEVTYEPTRVRWDIVYEDKDGTLPTSIEIVVDGDHYQMKELNETDQCTFDGKKYYYEMYLEPGTYEYYIEAEENNTLGPNNTVRTAFSELEISPPKPRWLGMTNMEIASIGTFLLLAVITLLYLRVKGRDKQKDSQFTDDTKLLDRPIKTLPVLQKKSEIEKKGTDDKSSSIEENKPLVKELPVLKKSDEDKSDMNDVRKHRLIKEEKQKEVIEEEQEEPIIDTVSEEYVEERDEDNNKKQRIIRNKKTIQPKKRVMKEDNSDKSKNGKMKRVLKED